MQKKRNAETDIPLPFDDVEDPELPDRREQLRRERQQWIDGLTPETPGPAPMPPNVVTFPQVGYRIRLALAVEAVYWNDAVRAADIRWGFR